MKNYLKKINNKSIKFLLCIGITVFFGIYKTFGQSENFSGTWNLDKQKTEFGNQPFWVVPVKYVIEQKDTSLDINKTIVDNQSQEIKSIVALSLNGNKIQVTNSSGNKATETCTKDAKDNIHIIITLPQPDGEDMVSEDWSLIIMASRY